MYANTESQRKLQNVDFAEESNLLRIGAISKADGEGFDAVSLSTCAANGLQRTPNQGEAESEAVQPDSDLKAVVDAWPALPEAIKAGIMAIVRAAGVVF